MKKLFETQFEKGSYLDSVSKVAGTDVNTSLRRSDKGLVLDCITSQYVYWSNSSNLVSIVLDIYVPSDVTAATSNIPLGSFGTNGILGFGASTGTFSSETFSWWAATPEDGGYIRDNISKGWHQIILVWNGSKYECWLDGSQVTDYQAAVPAPVVMSGNVYLGKRESLSVYYTGKIRKFVAYSDAIGSADIARLYDQLTNATLVSAEKYPRYNPHSSPTDYSNVPGCILSFSGGLTDRVWTDISATGNDCIVNTSLQQDVDGVRFNGVSSRAIFTRVNLGKTYTVNFRVKPADLTEFDIIANGSSSTNFIFLNNGTTISQRVGTGGTVDTLVNYNANEWINVSIVRNGTIDTIVYVNGVANARPLDADSDFTVRDIGSRATANYSEGVFDRLDIYNYAWSAKQAIDWHNSFAERETLIDSLVYDFKGDPVPKGWRGGTGTYDVREFTTQDPVLKHIQPGGKYWLCTIAGAMAIPSRQAFGTWEFDVYKSSEVNDASVRLMSTSPYIGAGAGRNAYRFRFGQNERYRMAITTDGVSTAFFYSAINYMAMNTWYGIKITRTSEGVWTMYVRGGAFGNTYQLVSVTGGLGTNPITEYTYKTSKYLIFDLDTGDRIANIKLNEEILR